MKRTKLALTAIGLSLSLSLSLCTAAWAADESTAKGPIVIEFLNVPHDERAAFLEKQNTAMRPLHERLAQEGKIVVWYLYEVRFPRGEGEYNYTVVTVFSDMSAYDERERALSYRGYRVGVDGARPTELMSPGYQTTESAYATVNFVRRPSADRDAFWTHVKANERPVLDEFVTKGHWMTWGMFERVGEPTFAPYDYAIVTRHATFADAEKPIHLPAPTTADELRPVLVNSQLWRLVDIVLAR